MGIADGAHDIEALGGKSEEIFGIFFWVDIFDEELDIIFRGDFAATLEGFDAIGVHFISREAGNGVAGLHNEASAFEFAHGGNKFAERFEKDFASGGIGQGLPDAGGAVEFDAEFALLAASVGKILL